jgi:tetratricopeptide (TPR) repeat protein
LRWSFCLVALLAISAGCGRSSQNMSTSQRIAVLRCENLSADASADWMGRAISEMLAAQIPSGPGSQVILPGSVRNTEARMGNRPALAPGISAERDAAIVAGANRVVSCECSVQGGVLRIAAQMEDLATRQMVQRAQAEGSAVNGLIGVTGALATQLWPQARPYATRSQEAVRAYAEGLDSPQAAAAGQAYARAVAADPNFGPGYLGWFEAEAVQRNPGGAERVLELAKARGDAIPADQRARLALDAAELHNDSAAQVQALAALVKAGTTDATVYKRLAEGAQQGRRYREAVNAYQQALALEPDDPALLNALGYAQAYLGEFDHSLDALRKYQKLQPNQANPIDSQADVNFYAGRYAEAEKLYLAAQAKDPNFLGGAEIMKAAQARLMTGDIDGADKIFQSYVKLIEGRHDPATTYRKAQWKYLTGHRREAIALLGAEASQLPLPLAQQAIWELSLGDKSAADHATKAVAAVKGGPVPAALAVPFLLTQPQTSAAEWEARATRIFGQSTMRDQMTGCALLVGKQFKEAVPYLRRAWDRTNPNNDEGVSVLLAWAMIESGNADGATSLVGPSPIPAAAGPGTLMSLYFPRLFYLRGRNFDRLGKHDQALENYKLFLKLAGKDAEIWGDEQRAQDALKH